MAQELFHTSAERGLAVGSFGYCTVARTARMSRGLQARLEDMCDYKHVFPPHDPRADMNPVAVSHTRISVDGQSYSVVSRIAAAAPDYSGRSNYLAHHVVLDGSERPPAGPAWLAMQPGVLANVWDGQVRELPAAKAVRRGEAGPAPCHAWQHATGDAGWAGVLAEHLLNKSSQPFYLIFEAGANLLPLIAEAVALLPPARRWDVTFSTYFTGAKGTMACTIRAVVKGTEEAAQARGAAHLDLTAPAGRLPPASDYVEAAREGRIVGGYTSVPTAASPLSFPLGPAFQPPDITQRAREAAAAGPVPRRTRPRPEFDFDDVPLELPPPSGGNKWIWILTGAAAALLLLGGVVVIALNANLGAAGTQVGQNDRKPDVGTEPKQRDDKSAETPEKKDGGGKPVNVLDPPKPPDATEKKPGNGTPGLAGKVLPKPPPGFEQPGDNQPPADPRIAEMQKKLKEMEDELKKVRKEKADADAAANKAAEELAAAQDKIKRWEARAWIEARKGDPAKVSLTDEQHKSAPFAEVLKPTEMYLVPKPGAKPGEKVAGKYYVSWNLTRLANEVQFDINAHTKPRQAEFPLYVRILLETVPSPEGKNVSGIRTSVFKASGVDADDHKAFVEYLKLHQLVIVETQQFVLGGRRFEFSPRITVVEFEEGK